MTSTWEGLAGEVLRRCDILGSLSEAPDRLTRTFLSPPMHEVQAYLRAWMIEAGMTVSTDDVGNVHGHFAPPGAGGPALLLGSHVDTVPGAGKFDGILGVLLAIGAVQAMRDAVRDAALPFPVRVLAFSEEEGTRFGVPFLGSRAVVGAYDGALLGRTDVAGVTVAEAIRRFGNDPGAVAAAALPPAAAFGYIEAHIEQGPVLEGLGVPLGVVSAITSQSRLTLTFTGRAGHAGTMPMAGRRDALCGGAALVLAVEREAQDTPGLVATVGQLQVQPGAANVIPGGAVLSLDVRHPQEAVRRRAVERLLAVAEGEAGRRGLRLDVRADFEQQAVHCDPELSAGLAGTLESLGLPAPAVVSGAGHDAMIMARRWPVAMLFLRSPGGISHHPDERVLPEDVALALEALVSFLRRLGRARQSHALQGRAHQGPARRRPGPGASRV